VVTSNIGATLREARVRRRLDLVDAEAETKIRVRYLRALENEEWDVLPGPTYTRSFIRTYAIMLGLDGERLADDFRRLQDHGPAERPREPVAPGPVPAGGGGGGPGISRGVVGALISIALIGVLVAIGLLGGDDATTPEGRPAGAATGTGGPQEAQERPAAPRQTELRLTALGEVWVCLIDGGGRPLVPGIILSEGAEEGPFRSGRFTVSFGNGAIEMTLNGEPAPLEDSANPVGYRIARGGKIAELAESERPTCT
jgi:hypothetical protein